MKIIPVEHLYPVDLEQVILGALLLDANAIHLVSSLLKPEHFGKHEHSLIYEAIFDCYSKSTPIDLLTVTESCRKLGTLETIGPVYLVELTNRVASAANLEYHCKLVLQSWGMRKIIRLSIGTHKEAVEPKSDFFELLNTLELEITSLKDGILSGSSRSLQNIVKSTLERIEKTDPDAPIRGIPLTGIGTFDRLIGGGEENDLIIIAGRPAMGKSSLVNSIILQACMHKTPLLMWSLEMSGEETLNRLAAAMSGLLLSKIRNNQLNKNEWQELVKTFEYISECPIDIQDNAGITVTDFRSKLIMLKRTIGLRVAILDRIGLLKFLNPNGNPVQEIERITKLLRRTAKETGVTIIALNQINRGVETRGGFGIPKLSDLRGSGSIEQDATKVIMVYRPEYYNITEDENGESTAGKAILLIEKNTFGETGQVLCRFDAERTQFLELEENYFLDTRNKIEQDESI